MGGGGLAGLGIKVWDSLGLSSILEKMLKWFTRSPRARGGFSGLDGFSEVRVLFSLRCMDPGGGIKGTPKADEQLHLPS